MIKEIGTAGIKANIVHWDAVVRQRSDELQAALEQLNYWLKQAQKDIDAKTLHV